MPNITTQELFKAGVHFGHQTQRWNPKMKPYIYGAKSGIYVIDLSKTVKHLESAIKFTQKITAEGGKILFVGTKRQAKEIIQKEAEAAKMPYVSERWLGGTLTNFNTIKMQINKLDTIKAKLEQENSEDLTKKEKATLNERKEKLEQLFGGIKDMESLPKAIFVVDALREKISLAEAKKLGIPIIAIADSNADPSPIDYLIPANDDAIESINLITHLISEAAAEGHKVFLAKQKQLKNTEASDQLPED